MNAYVSAVYLDFTINSPIKPQNCKWPVIFGIKFRWTQKGSICICIPYHLEPFAFTDRPCFFDFPHLVNICYEPLIL